VFASVLGDPGDPKYNGFGSGSEEGGEEGGGGFAGKGEGGGGEYREEEKERFEEEDRRSFSRIWVDTVHPTSRMHRVLAEDMKGFLEGVGVGEGEGLRE